MLEHVHTCGDLGFTREEDEHVPLLIGKPFLHDLIYPLKTCVGVRLPFVIASLWLTRRRVDYFNRIDFRIN